MSGFDLLSLNPELFDKVINKLKGENYFHLQQTCRTVNELIHSNSRISVHIEREHCLKYNPDTSSWKFAAMIIGNCRIRTWENIDIEAFYGTRLERLNPCHLEADFDVLCESLKKNRITCQQLAITSSEGSDEQWIQLLDTVKAEGVDLASEGSNHYELLFRAKTLKEATVRVKLAEVAAVMPALLPKFPEVHLVSYVDAKLSNYREVLEVLYSQDWPNLQTFTFTTEWNTFDHVSEDDIEAAFEGFNFTAKEKENDKCTMYITMDLPQQFPPGSTCKMIIETSGWTGGWLQYKRADSA